ncbi:MAG: lipid-A-disaccharide synthase [Methylobacillus sp.]|jgi:lipid-A-disaccharide synthase|nr:lipid-A-disaccharide synthase [Methylobacillus sp.]
MTVIGIVAGEASGDLLGSHLIRALKHHRPDLEFVGVAGSRMQAEGAVSLFPMERLAVRGLFEVLKHLFGILRIRRGLLAHFKHHPPDLFIGIDAPDFNLGLERKLKGMGIPTVHYVSPSIWAWRKGRINKIRRAVSHVLALLPFEAPLYEEAGVPVTYVGHPLADEFPMQPDPLHARAELGLPTDKPIFALLPGSRQSELDYLADLFVQSALLIRKHMPEAVFVVPLASQETRLKFETALAKHPAEKSSFHILSGQSHRAMEAADAVIVASGTATLEAALLKKPMVITYRVSAASWWLLRRMVRVPCVGLPNILAGKAIVPELLQHDATPEKIAEAAIKLLADKNATAEMLREFETMHATLRRNTAEKAAQAILGMLK